jgi:hypothetical protein
MSTPLGFRCQLRVDLGLEERDVRELTVTPRVVESVADHEMIGYGEAYPVRFEWGFAASWLVEQHAGMDGCGIARENFVLYARQGIAGIEDVVDEKDVAVLDLGSEVAQDARARLRGGGVAVTGHANAIEP